MASSDALVWALVVVAFVLGVVTTIVVMRLSSGPTPKADQAIRPLAYPTHGVDVGHGAGIPATPPGMRPPGLPPHGAGIGGAVQALVLTVTADHLAPASRALVVCPPGERLPMVWHVHLAAVAALSVPDGRTIPLTPPPSTHDWKLPTGRRVRLAEGRAEHQVTHDAVTVQVTGPYVKVMLASDGAQHQWLIATAFGDPRGPSELRADLSDLPAAEAALRQAIDLAAGSHLAGTPTVLGYSRAAWEGHTRYWLDAYNG